MDARKEIAMRMESPQGKYAFEEWSVLCQVGTDVRDRFDVERYVNGEAFSEMTKQRSDTERRKVERRTRCNCVSRNTP